MKVVVGCELQFFEGSLKIGLGFFEFGFRPFPSGSTPVRDWSSIQVQISGALLAGCEATKQVEPGESGSAWRHPNKFDLAASNRSVWM